MKPYSSELSVFCNIWSYMQFVNIIDNFINLMVKMEIPAMHF